MAATQRTTGATRLKGPTVITLRGGGSKGRDRQTVGAGADVGLSVQIPTAQTANAFTVEKPDGTVIAGINSAGVLLESAANGLTALAGGGQAGATPITAAITRFTTVATAADSALLPLAAPGLGYFTINSGANALAVFPSTGDAINALAANTAFSLPAGKTATFISAVAGFWHAILSA